MRNKPLLIWQSVLAGLQVMAGASTLAEILPTKWLAVFIVLVAALQVGTANFVHGLVTIPEQTPVVVAEKGSDVSITTSPTTTASGAGRSSVVWRDSGGVPLDGSDVEATRKRDEGRGLLD